MKRVAVVGAGVIGVSSLLRLLEERSDSIRDNFDNDIDYNVEVIWIYDSTIPIFGIGESTTPFLPEVVTSSYLRYNIKDKFDATIKYGNKFIGWGNNGKNFIRWFTVDRNGFHFDTEKYSKFFIDYVPKTFNDVKVKDEKVTNIRFDDDNVYINNEKYDFVIDCTGGKSLLNDEEYSDASFVSVNSCLALPLPNSENWGVTISKTTKNGWMFGIPLQTRRTFGYCYNSNITTEEEAFEDFKDIIPEAEDYPYKKFTWNPQFSNYFIHPNGKYIRNGNALGLVEPLESFAGAYYDSVNERICEYIWGIVADRSETDSVDEMNEWYNREVVNDWYKNLAWIYHFGSNHKSLFWKKMIKESRDYLNDKDKNPCGLIDEDSNFTDDLPNIIGDDKKMRDSFFHNLLDLELGSEFEFFSLYYNFISFASGAGAEYAYKFPSNEMLTEFDDEQHGELNFKLK